MTFDKNDPENVSALLSQMGKKRHAFLEQTTADATTPDRDHVLKNNMYVRFTNTVVVTKPPFLKRRKHKQKKSKKYWKKMGSFHRS